MGFRNWVLSLLGGVEKGTPETPSLVPGPSRDPIEEEAAGLNFFTAIEAHQKWKVRLMAVIDGDSSEGLSVEVIGRDDQCALGKWIHGAGSQFSQADEFTRLKKNHAFFHECAARVLHLAQAGDKTAALEELRRGRYPRASNDVIQDLAVMFRRATEGRT